MKRLSQLLLFIFVSAIAHGECPQSAEGFEPVNPFVLAVRHRIIVRPFDPVAFRSQGKQIVESVLDTHDLILPIREIGSIGAFVVEVPSFSTEQLLGSFERSTAFQWSEPDYVVREMVNPHDDLFQDQWNLPQIAAPNAWNRTQGSRKIVVAVIDSGMLLTHSDLANNRFKAKTAYKMKVGSTLISCSAGDGGYDAVTGICNPVDDTGHGTHVAGIIGAEGNNVVFGAGVNWMVQLLPLRFIGPLGTGCVSDAVDMLDYARQAGEVTGANVRVVNMSWGLYASPRSLQSEIALVHAAKILLVGAAGNNANDNDVTPFYPASYTSDVLSVAASDQADALVAGISNYGKTSVHLGAPGVNIISTWNVAPYFMIRSGTSMAAPHVSGAAALLWSACQPTADQMKQLLVSTVDVTPGLRGKTVSNGRLNVDLALTRCIALYP